jgi:tetratricopeptide (TPR) repeat protein
LAASAANRDELYSAMRGKARCLRAMGRLKLALSALEPISVEPQTPAECLQLALAGELLLQMRKYQEAESSLEVALDGVRDEEEKYAQWTAVASANLGNAYLRNGKLRQSKTMYGKAAKLFHYLNNPELEKKCFKLTLALDQIQTLE